MLFENQRIQGKENLIKLAAVQTKPQFGAVKKNLKEITKKIEQLSGEGVNLAVFPELATTGYIFNSREEVSYLAECIPEGPSTQQLLQVSKECNIYVCIGILEKDSQNPTLFYNSAVLIAPYGYVGTYRKNHLWGEEKLFIEVGNLGIPVYLTPLGKISMIICRDQKYPECCRIAALQGADLVLSPSNWLEVAGIENYDQFSYCISNYRAISMSFQNTVFSVCANRVGEERGHTFLGKSIIVSPTGTPAAGPASKNDEEVLCATVNLMEACKEKASSGFNNLFHDRRIDLYDKFLGYPLHLNPKKQYETGEA